MSILNFLRLPFKVSKQYFFIKIFQVLFDGFYPLLEVYAFTNLVSQILKLNLSGNKNHALIAIILFFMVLFLKYFIDILISRISLNPIKKINLYLEKRIIKKNLALEYYYIEDSDLYDKLNLAQKEIFNDFIQKHNKICSIFRVLFQLISISIMIYMSIGIRTLIILCAIACVYFISNYNGKKSYIQKKDDAILDRKCDYYSDVLCNAEFGQERMLYNYSKKLNEIYLEMNKKLIKHEKIVKLKNTFRMESSSFLTLLILIYFLIELSVQVKLGIVSMGFLIAIIKQLSNFLNIIRWELFSILQIKSELSNYLKDFDELENFTEVKNGNIEIDDIKLIEIKNLSFTYPNSNKMTLNNINYKFEKGKSYALVGENGCGKTTLVKLLLALYNDFRGDILINNIPLTNISNESKSNCFAVVFQDYGKYYLTLIENIKLGNFDVNNIDLEDAIKLFSLEDLPKFLILRKGDENSVNISEGQWQNIALARNYISKAGFVIFDEPTASLSPSQESKIYTFLKEIVKDKTAIFISHRLGICPIVDEVLVLNKGKILESGSHNSLIKKDKLYAKMYKSQKELYV